MYRDKDLKTYDALGFDREPSAEGFDMALLEGTPPQMGGNLIVTKEGKILYILRSSTPDERPTVEDLLKVIG